MQTIGDAISQALPDLRAQAESMMTEHCVIERPTGTQYDPASHRDESTWQPVYTGRCHLQPVSAASAELTELVGQQINSLTHHGTVPLSVTDLQADDRLTITASDDPAQIGRRYTLTAVQSGSHAVARRFTATENQG